ncbi:MAG TPA: hypothetical protein PLT32_01755 [bacterium]|nr:hypothetical protein [bacterium]
MSGFLNKKISLPKLSSLTRKNVKNALLSNGQNGGDKNELLEFLNNNYSIFIGLICLVAVIVSFLGYFWPEYQNTLLEVSDNYQQAKIELDNKQKYQSNLIKLNEFYRSIDKATRDKVFDMLPVELNKENILAEIEAICLANSLMIKSSDVKAVNDESVEIKDEAKKEGETNEAKPKAKQENKVNSAMIKLELQGKEYDSFKGLLRTIENNLHLMNIKNVEYFPAKNQVVLSIQIYYLGD